MNRSLTPRTLGSPSQGTAQRRAGPGCPRCGQRRIWQSWIDTIDQCPECRLDLDRHGWLAAMWLQTWITILVVVGWIVVGLIVASGAGPWWVSGGALLLALTTPPLTYRYSKGIMLRILYKLDPPSSGPTHG